MPSLQNNKKNNEWKTQEYSNSSSTETIICICFFRPYAPYVEFARCLYCVVLDTTLLFLYGQTVHRHHVFLQHGIRLIFLASVCLWGLKSWQTYFTVSKLKEDKLKQQNFFIEHKETRHFTTIKTAQRSGNYYDNQSNVLSDVDNKSIYDRKYD